MKDRVTIFATLMLFAPGAMAATGAVSRVVPGITDAAMGTQNVVSRMSDDTTQPDVTARVTVRSNAVRVDGGNTNESQSVRTTASRVLPSGGAGRVDVATTVRANATPARNATPGRGGLDAAVNTVGRNSRVSDASINSDPAVRRAGLVLRPSTAEVGGRATIDNRGTQTGSNIDEVVRGMRTRVAQDATRESIAEATNRLEQTAALNKSCQEQYNECMDQFCAVVDANQKRCSCSANLGRYTKVEDAVKDANAQLNEVAQRIRYVGLSADEIRAILTETEAEQELSGQTDTSETRNMLEQIEAMIRDPKSSTSYSADTSSDFGLDLDLDFSSESADLFSLDFLNTDTGSSMSKMRGVDLYNAAKKRCKTVLNECANAGATTKQITGNYDLAIDKDCIAYEQGLEKMNDTLVSNVRSANLMLQKARLAVLQNQNAYDAKGCVAALESCMTDDMVCGADYYRCVDPTKQYIDENGDVVLGQNISNILEFMEKYNNAAINKDFIETAEGQKITNDACIDDADDGKTGGNDGSCVVNYLMTKIGTGQRVTDNGLCRAVLDKCRRYTYTDDTYNKHNDVVVNYIQRAMVNIRAAQHKIISDYASTCMVDVANCYNQQVTQVNAWSTGASVDNVYRIMRGACRNVALTCSYAIFYKDVMCLDGDQLKWGDACEAIKPKNDDDSHINAISEMFYQSLLCPDNSVYNKTGKTATVSTKQGDAQTDEEKQWVNEYCRCDDAYEKFGTSCVIDCTNGQTRNPYGTCVGGGDTTAD